MSLPRHAIDRLCALHLIAGLLDAATVPVRDGGLTEEERGRAAVLCSRIAQARDRAERMEPEHKGNPRLVNSIHRKNGILWNSFGEDVDAREAVVMVMGMVAECEEALPRTPALLAKRLEWGQLHTLLGELYEAIDPDLTGVAQIEKGALVGAMMGAA
jgi:hypothetical protein